MKIIIKPDTQKAKALIEMAKITLKRLEEINQEKYPSNTLTDCYDIIHKLMEALTLSAGIKFSGDGAHKELIDFITQEYKLEESSREFFQQMREYRNRIAYEGFMIKENYVTLNKIKINKLIGELLFLQIKNVIENILPNSPLDFELKHSELVLKWVLNLKSDADEALKIAALSHDIDRAITKITEKDLKDYSKINEFKKEHSIRSAKFICDILKNNNYPQSIIDKVKHLVENHEFGGDEESNILMDADSLAYFEYNIHSYLKRNGIERAKEKIKFMYKRLSTEAKKLLNQIKFKDQEIAELVKESISEL